MKQECPGAERRVHPVFIRNFQLPIFDFTPHTRFRPVTVEKAHFPVLGSAYGAKNQHIIQ